MSLIATRNLTLRIAGNAELIDEELVWEGPPLGAHGRIRQGGKRHTLGRHRGMMSNQGIADTSTR